MDTGREASLGEEQAHPRVSIESRCAPCFLGQSHRTHLSLDSPPRNPNVDCTSTEMNRLQRIDERRQTFAAIQDVDHGPAALAWSTTATRDEL